METVRQRADPRVHVVEAGLDRCDKYLDLYLVTSSLATDRAQL